MINIAKLLKNCPKGTKLYSPLFGEVKFKYINDSEFGIVVEDSEECCRSFDKYGRYFTIYNNAECLLFPSKECRTWEGWKVPSKPNFKVNDWIIFDKTITIPIQIVEVNQKDGVYRCKSIEGFYGHYNIAQTDKEYHLWSIADANDGDILVTTKVRGCPFIYRKTDYNNNLAYYYAGIDGNGNFCEGCLKRTLFHFGQVKNVVPAAKQQRDLLFKKMKEAGYEWDANKKELRKIQPHYDIANFQPFDKVLVRCGNDDEWMIEFFCKYDTLVHTAPHRDYPFMGIGDSYSQCIPFEGNEHLLGTADMCDEQYINW